MHKNDEVIIHIGDRFLLDGKNQVTVSWTSEKDLSFASTNGCWNGWMTIENFLKRAVRIGE